MLDVTLLACRNMSSLDPPVASAPSGFARWICAALRPVTAFRLRYLPLVMVYFAYGALGLIDVSRDMWIKEHLTLTPAELAGVGVWLSLPWTVKMVFGELVDSIPLFGSSRRAYILLGTSLTAMGLLVLAGAAGRWLVFSTPDQLYLLGALLMVIGVMIQDVVADAMSTEVVDRFDENGNLRAKVALREELGMVQVIGRLALSLGILMVAGLSGLLATFFSRETVFLMGLGAPAISAAGALFIRSEPASRRQPDWRILLGGIAFGLTIVAFGLGDVAYGQEVAFFMSMVVICTMLVIVTRDLDRNSRQAILFATVIIFAFRASPSAGDGYFWWTLDVLKFDESFYGILRQTGAVLAFVSMWMLSKQITAYSVSSVLMFVVIAGTILTLPNIGLIYGLHHWTESVLGIGARSIALVDVAAASPFAQLSMIPLLTLVAYYAPSGHRATWFALMASLMNLALVAGQLQTKYLNEIFVVSRGSYEQLGALLLVTTMIGFVIPMAAILLFGRRV